jgi:cell wall-associated NlpC family hydrolase
VHWRGHRARLAIAAAAAALCAGCAQQSTVVSSTGSRSATSSSTTSSSTTSEAPGPTLHVHPHVVQPVAGAAPKSKTPPPAGTTASVHVSSPSQNVALAQPLSNAQVEKELAQSGMSSDTRQATLTPDGLAVAPVGAPAEVQAIINAGNQIALLPYRYAGGHLTYQDTAYDCSGSISYVLAAAHLLGYTVNSTALETYGDPGPGKWVTIFANAGHTFMYVAGLRFDTVALAETGSRWSDRKADEPDLSTFIVRHPPGL